VKPSDRASNAGAKDVSIDHDLFPRNLAQLQNQAPKSPAAVVQSEEEKKAERLAKLEAWKRKLAEEKEKKEKDLGAGGNRKVPEEVDQKAGTPKPASPD